MSTTVEKIAHLAKSQVGYREGRDKSGNWNNDEKYARQVPGLSWANFQPWCAVYVCWLFFKTLGRKAFGTVLPYQPTASCDVAMAAYKAAGRWSEYPAAGAQGFLGVPGDARHTFFVERFDDAFVYTNEGNTNDDGSYQGDGVYDHKRLRRDPELLGYGYPNYPEGIASADPKWSSEHPAAKNPKPKPHRAAGPNVAAADKAASKGQQYAKKHDKSEQLGLWAQVRALLKKIGARR